MAFRNYHGSDRSSTARSAMTGGGMAVKRLGRETGGQEPPNFTISATEGETASATISGTHPNWHIELVLPRGQDGTDGVDGTNGYCECNCECCNPTDPTECPSGYSWNGFECVPDNTECPEGYYWNGSECVPNDPPPEENPV